MLVPGRLPGSYSVRGDWFLAIAAGSRSTLLGERAIDIISSRKANLYRLKHGIGLPTRDFSDDATSREAPSSLTVTGQDDREEFLTYGDLLSLGAQEDKSEFRWLWRYTMPDYDRQAAVFLQMVAVTLKRCPGYWRDLVLKIPALRFDNHPNVKVHPRSGFEAYDYLIEELLHPPTNRHPCWLKSFSPYLHLKDDCEAWKRRLEDSGLRAEWE